MKKEWWDYVSLSDSIAKLISLFDTCTFFRAYVNQKLQKYILVIWQKIWENVLPPNIANYVIVETRCKHLSSIHVSYIFYCSWWRLQNWISRMGRVWWGYLLLFQNNLSLNRRLNWQRNNPYMWRTWYVFLAVTCQHICQHLSIHFATFVNH